MILYAIIAFLIAMVITILYIAFLIVLSIVLAFFSFHEISWLAEDLFSSLPRLYRALFKPLQWESTTEQINPRNDQSYISKKTHYSHEIPFHIHKDIETKYPYHKPENDQTKEYNNHIIHSNTPTEIRYCPDCGKKL